ncbi:homoserine dehydrogenase [Clostridium gasigenes]|uniref:Homoserine dehydrogenase n=1 Tax=Clostridium gasigenes TaxID=94869 RepID=A0A7X0RAK9_9CLOT|nr:homoserine dehydrogenase [Clostridium gasigenes]MBB6623464.1 homoserine dehydrogenase [Clostridium gasigenes]MBB6715337.1 homoserine dehydrogenase [Clostridium gasigenes]MBU3089643.1 homoserine dehydrogenase [Clostridium gasigenes]
MDIGVIGFGGVGKAFIELLIMKKDKIDIKVKYIIKSNGGIYNSNAINIEELIDFVNSGKSICEYSKWIDKDITINTIIKNRDIDTLVELTGTNIEDGEPGYTHIKLALENGINVVTGNKGPILLYYNELKDIAYNNNVQLGIGCTTGGALPSINGGLLDTAGAEILSIEGVLNGTSNYILKEMYDKKIEYSVALEEAQKMGIAEANPKLDVDGFDTASKILILANVLMGYRESISDIYIKGISEITADEVNLSISKGEKIKLIGMVYKEGNCIKCKVEPKSLKSTHPLYFVDGKNKGVYYKTDTLGDISIIGGASGTINSAASILRDIINIKNGVKFI